MIDFVRTTFRFTLLKCEFYRYTLAINWIYSRCKFDISIA